MQAIAENIAGGSDHLQSIENRKQMLVGDIALEAYQVSPLISISKVKRLFQEDGPLSAVVVVDDGRPMGLVMSIHLDRMLSQRYGFAVYHNRPIRKVMDAAPMIVDENDSVEEVAEAAMQREKERLYDHVIVTAGGELKGIVAVRKILISLTHLHKFRTDELAVKNQLLKKEIEERKQTEEALKQSRHSLNEAQAMARIGSWQMNLNTREVQCSNEFRSIFGIPDGKVTMDQISKIVHPNDRNYQDAHIFRSIRDAVPWDVEFRILHETEGEKIIHAKGEPVLDEWGRVLELVGTVQDITDRKKIETEKEKLETRLRQAHKMEAIGTLAGGIAHDFNNILGIILGNTELAMDEMNEFPVVTDNLKEVCHACIRARDVVQQLLSFARKTEMAKMPLFMHVVVEDSIKLLRSSIPANISIKTDLEDITETILADATQMNQILINLCTNASHAMPDGGMITIRSFKKILNKSETPKCGMTEGKYICLMVEDTGCGIPLELQERVFDPYFTTKEVGKGSGMGLAVVHGIVDNHGGYITVKSEPGLGTAFTILIPASIQRPDPINLEYKKPPTGNERILLVDDEKAIAEIGCKQLKRLGYHTELYTDSQHALSLFRENPDQYDLVLTDMMMPRMTGDILATEILKIRPKLPIILCTGFTEEITQDKAIELGFSAYLQKPIKRNVLAETVKYVLKNKGYSSEN